MRRVLAPLRLPASADRATGLLGFDPPAGPSSCSSFVELSMSVKRKVTVPVGSSGIVGEGVLDRIFECQSPPLRERLVVEVAD